MEVTNRRQLFGTSNIAPGAWLPCAATAPASMQWQQIGLKSRKFSAILATGAILGQYPGDGSVVTVKGESVGVGGKVFIQNRKIKGAAPDLAQYEMGVSDQELRLDPGFCCNQSGVVPRVYQKQFPH